jgi:hypothetical protein
LLAREVGDEIFSNVENLSRKIISPDYKLSTDENFSRFNVL